MSIYWGAQSSYFSWQDVDVPSPASFSAGPDKYSAALEELMEALLYLSFSFQGASTMTFIHFSWTDSLRCAPWQTNQFPSSRLPSKNNNNLQNEAQKKLWELIAEGAQTDSRGWQLQAPLLLLPQWEQICLKRQRQFTWQALKQQFRLWRKSARYEFHTTLCKKNTIEMSVIGI